MNPPVIPTTSTLPFSPRFFLDTELGRISLFVKCIYNDDLILTLNPWGTFNLGSSSSHGSETLRDSLVLEMPPDLIINSSSHPLVNQDFPVVQHKEKSTGANPLRTIKSATSYASSHSPAKAYGPAAKTTSPSESKLFIKFQEFRQRYGSSKEMSQPPEPKSLLNHTMITKQHERSPKIVRAPDANVLEARAIAFQEGFAGEPDLLDLLEHPRELTEKSTAATRPYSPLPPPLILLKYNPAAQAYETVRSAPANMIKFSTPLGPSPNIPRKVYCQHWIHHGTCNYNQTGCKFKHEIPPREHWDAVGLKELPQWYRDQQSKHHRVLVDTTTDNNNTKDQPAAKATPLGRGLEEFKFENRPRRVAIKRVPTTVETSTTNTQHETTLENAFTKKRTSDPFASVPKGLASSKFAVASNE
jgi:hypothetical protein